MSFVTTQPEMSAAAGGNLQRIAAAQFVVHANRYQAISAQAAAVHEMFVSALSATSGSYAATEVANAAAAR